MTHVLPQNISFLVDFSEACIKGPAGQMRLSVQVVKVVSLPRHLVLSGLLKCGSMFLSKTFKNYLYRKVYINRCILKVNQYSNGY